MDTAALGKMHRFQEESGWCGPASIQMILTAAGIEKSQKEIAKDVYLSWWGTSWSVIVSYLSRFFGKLGYQENSSTEEIAEHLKKNHLIIVDWWDDLDGEPADGHYSLIGALDEKTKIVTLLDPSRSRKGIWDMNLKDFEKRWFDYLGVHNQIKSDRFLIWVDPASRL